MLCALASDVTAIGVEVADVPFAPQTVMHRAKWGGERFDNYSQQDAYEAFGALMDACEEVDSVAAHALLLPELTVNGGTNSTRYSTPFWHAFGGLSRSTVHCRACGHADSKYDVWSSLTVALPHETSTIEVVLANHWGTEFLSDPTDRCEQDNCLALRQRSQTTHPERWPRVLVVHLKRWKVVSVAPFKREKSCTQINFESLLLIQGERAPYHLRGLVVHRGDAGGGHYTAYVRGLDTCWYFCDDYVPPRRVPPTDVFRDDVYCNAYMLFYENPVAGAT